MSALLVIHFPSRRCAKWTPWSLAARRWSPAAQGQTQEPGRKSVLWGKTGLRQQ